MIGLDISAIIDIFKGDKNIRKFLDENKEPLASTSMSYLELFFGINPENPRHLEEGEYYREFFKSIYMLELTYESCEQASGIFWALKKQGKTIGQFDCVIAAIFISNGVNKILTRNEGHFDKIKQLEVITY